MIFYSGMHFFPKHEKNTYRTSAFIPKDPTIPPIISSPINHDKFYNNLISKNFKKTIQKNYKFFSFDYQGYGLVPYHTFKPNKKQVTIYPASVFREKLDVPIILKGTEKGSLEILGTGFLQDCHEKDNRLKGITYWELDNSITQRAKKSLIERLGKI